MSKINDIDNNSENNQTNFIETLDYKLEITGELPFEFTGIEIFSGTTRDTSLNQNRYYVLDIYEAKDDDGKYYLAHIEYETCWDGENDFRCLYDADNLNELKNLLDSYDPLAYLVGFPTGDRYIEKQNKLKEQLSFKWQELKIEALTDLGVKRKERGRKALRGDSPPEPTATLKIDPQLKKEATDKNIDLSEFLNEALIEKFGWV